MAITSVPLDQLSPSEWRDFYSFWQGLMAVTKPYRQGDSYEKFYKSWTVFPQFIDMHPHLLVDTEKIVGFLRYWHDNPKSASYEKNKTILNSDVHLAPSGNVASYLQDATAVIKNDFLAKDLEVWQLGLFQANLADIAAGWPQFQLVNREQLFLLNCQMLNQASQDISTVSGYTIRQLKFDVPHQLEQICHIYNEANQDIPTQEMSRLELKFDAAFWHQRVVDLRQKGDQILAFGAFTGDTIVGLTTVIGQIQDPTVFDVNLTGVLREHRGQGLAKWLKNYSLAYLLEHFSSLKWLSTSTNQTNAPMYALNKKLGFEEAEGFHLFRYTAR